MLTVLNDSKLEIKAKGKPAVAMDGGKMTWLAGASDLIITNPEKRPSSFFALIMERGSARAKP